MSERRFNEAETAAIFELAARTQNAEQKELPAGEGMTLSQVTDIAREVGIAPEFIARAAASVRVGRPVARTFLGLPIGVGRTVELDRRLSEEEWDAFVVDLRETFDARGVVRSEGSLRQWSNGNLQALLEPSGTGYRIRLRSVKGDARPAIVGGLTLVASAVTALVALTAVGAGTDVGAVTALSTMGAAGAVMSALGALRLPGWARLRRQQMESVAERVLARTSQPHS